MPALPASHSMRAGLVGAQLRYRRSGAGPHHALSRSSGVFEAWLLAGRGDLALTPSSSATDQT